MQKQRTVQECEKWLCDFLEENGKTMVEVIRNVARFNGFTKGQVSQAKKKLNLESTNNFNTDTGLTTEWYWELKK